MRTGVGILTGIALLLLAPAGVARADDEGGAGGTGSAYVDDDGNLTAEAKETNSSAGRRTSGSATDCRWKVLNADDRAFAVYDENGIRLHSDTGRWLAKYCDGGPVEVGEGFATGERRRTPRSLAQEARQSVAIPEPPLATSPAAERRLYVGVPTWLWVDPGWWRPYSATAAAGGVTTTVTARPVRARWSTGDGAEVSCDGPGLPWRRGLAEDATACAHRYLHSSAGQPGGTYTISVTVELEVAWTSSTGAGGALPAVTRSSSRPVVVGEIQAIETA